MEIKPSPPAPHSTRTVFSWALYSFAETIFSMNILSLYFALWVTVDKGAEDIAYSIALSASMLLVAITMPILGALSDFTQRRIPYLVVLTVICVIATGFLGFIDNLYLALFIFAIANYNYQSGQVFYNSLIPWIAQGSGSSIGRVAGYGTAMSYMGSIAGLLLVKPFVDYGGRTWAFLPTAVLFLLFSLPCFLWVKEPPPGNKNNSRGGVTPLPGDTPPKRKLGAVLSESFKDPWRTLQNARRYPGLVSFLIANLIYLDAIQTVVVFMSVYLKKVGSFTDQDLRLLLIFSTCFAVGGAYIWGRIAERLGGKKTMNMVLLLWALSLGFAALAHGMTTFWFLGPLVGLGLGGIWVASKTMVVELSPPEKVGEFFGLFGLAGKTASIIGPLLWGQTVAFLYFMGKVKYRYAIAIMLVLVLAGGAVFQRVPESKPKKNV